MYQDNNININGKNIARTSIISFHEPGTQNLIKTQDKKAMEFFKSVPRANGKMLAQALGIHDGKASRIISSLRDKNLIVFAGKFNCTSSPTRRLSNWYSIANQEGSRG